MTLLEAMSLSKPCIVTNVGGNPEIIINDVNGKVVPNEATQEFASAMIELLEDPLLRNRLGENGHSRFREYFSVDTMVDNYMSVYSTLIKGS